MQNRISFNPITWVINSLSHSDLRPDKPIASRYTNYTPGDTSEVPEDWKRHVEPPPQFYSRHNENSVYLRKFCPASRCAEWSTLREMLPGTQNSPRSDEDKTKTDDGNKFGEKPSCGASLLNTRCGGRHHLNYSPMTK